MNLRTEEGWSGTFTRDHYPGAIPNETVIKKINSEPGDGHPDGSIGTILGSIGHSSLSEIGYFVEWSARPYLAVFVTGKKLMEVMT